MAGPPILIKPETTKKTNTLYKPNTQALRNCINKIHIAMMDQKQTVALFEHLATVIQGTTSLIYQDHAAVTLEVFDLNASKHELACEFISRRNGVFRLTLMRENTQLPFNNTDRVFMQWLAQHLRLFFLWIHSPEQLIGALNKNGSMNAKAEDRNMDRLNSGSTTLHQRAVHRALRPYWLIDADGYIHYQNTAAQCLKQQTVIFQDLAFRLIPATPIHEEHFQEALRHVQNGMNDEFERCLLGPNQNALQTFWIKRTSDNARFWVSGPKKLPTACELQQVHKLTKRQAELCLLIINGHTLRAAAQQMNISSNTARNSLNSCFELLDVNNQPELVFLLLTTFESWYEKNVELAVGEH